jgi:hypothetical protein
MEEVKKLSEKDKKKMYNTKYYNKHRNEMLVKLREKEQCPLCGKMISLSNLSRHQKGSGCINKKCCEKQTIKIDKNEFQELKDKLIELENKMKNNTSN